MSVSSIESAKFRHVLGHYPTGVAAITAGSSAGPLGLVVGSFTSVSLDPPLVGFLPDRTSTTWPLIAATGQFAVNLLASDQGALCRQLARRGDDKFTGVDWNASPRGLPLIAGVIATIECRVHEIVDAGDHWFVMGRVEDLEVHRDTDPMLFFRGRYGGFAG